MKVLKNENSYRIKEFFVNTSRRLGKESINKILSTNNLVNIYNLILDNKLSVRNSFIQTLRITFDASMSKQLVYGLDFEEEVWAQLKLLQSDANDVQIWFR